MAITPTPSPNQIQETGILIKYLIFPIVVSLLAVLASFFATYVQKRRFKSSEIKSKTTNIYDNLIIDLGTLIELFEKLKTDNEERGMYYIKNINLGVDSVKHIRTYIDDIYLFNDETLRRRLIECIDSTSTIFTDILGLEKFAIDRQDTYLQSYKESRKELRSIQMKIIKQDLKLNENGYATSDLLSDFSLDIKTRTKLLSTIESINKILQDVHDEFNAKETETNRQIAQDEKRRLSFNFRLLDTQTKIREVLFQLTNERNSI